MGIIHQLLFIQNMKTNSGQFFEKIAMQIEEVSTPILDV